MYYAPSERVCVQAAMQRLRGAEGSPPAAAPPASPAPDAPRAPLAPHAPHAAPQRFPLYATNDDINRQLRDLLQRHPDKMWPPREYCFVFWTRTVDVDVSAHNNPNAALVVQHNERGGRDRDENVTRDVVTLMR